MQGLPYHGGLYDHEMPPAMRQSVSACDSTLCYRFFRLKLSGTRAPACGTSLFGVRSRCEVVRDHCRYLCSSLRFGSI